MNKIRVDLKDRSYDVLVGIDRIPELGKLLEKMRLKTKVVVVTDSLVKKLWGGSLKAAFKGTGQKVAFITVPRGEKYKNLQTAEKLFGKLADLETHRDSLIVPFGGGVIGDLAAFVASTYMRGLNYVQVPTTLLSQVDSSVGGKTAVNHAQGKNLVGTFYQPKLVFTDVQFLKTLPDKELKTGLAEVVKYGVIEDQDLFKFLENNSHHLNTRAFAEEDTTQAAFKIWQRIVTESVAIKARIVSRDETEEGLRMVLNFGHTIGHALELITKYRKFTHGEAVSVGMCAAARCAVKMGLSDSRVLERVETLLNRLGLPTRVEDISCQAVVSALNVDKKVRNNQIQFVLTRQLGRVEVRNDVTLSVIKEVLKEIGCK